jgi:DNA-directed RNA polymerase subunit RPC12/RpoP
MNIKETIINRLRLSNSFDQYVMMADLKEVFSKCEHCGAPIDLERVIAEKSIEATNRCPFCGENIIKDFVIYVFTFEFEGWISVGKTLAHLCEAENGR